MPENSGSLVTRAAVLVMVSVVAPFSFTLVGREAHLGFERFPLVTGTIWGLLGKFPLAWHTVRGDYVLPKPVPQTKLSEEQMPLWQLSS